SRVVVVAGRERDVGSGEQRVGVELWLVESEPDSLGLASVCLGFRWPAERARDERVAARAGRGTAEVERLRAPVLDQLAVGLFLPAYCALERAFAEERRSFARRVGIVWQASSP